MLCLGESRHLYYQTALDPSSRYLRVYYCIKGVYKRFHHYQPIRTDMKNETVALGFARGLFSNEAGLGSAPNMYAYMSVDHPGRVGLYGIFEVFMD
ncbi:MAG: alanine:cation symporter family protein, partial [Desulfurococcus sp.]